LHELKDAFLVPIEDPVPEGISWRLLADDLNTPKAYAELNVLAKAAAEEKTAAAKSALLRAGEVCWVFCSKILQHGLDIQRWREWGQRRN
jgi:hypothetical protein